MKSGDRRLRQQDTDVEMELNRKNIGKRTRHVLQQREKTKTQEDIDGGNDIRDNKTENRNPWASREAKAVDKERDGKIKTLRAIVRNRNRRGNTILNTGKESNRRKNSRSYR